MENSRSKGTHGENLACNFLQSQGYKIITRNYRWRGGEIDLIAEDEEEALVFFEVKSDFSQMAGDPGEWINHRKIQRIRKTAEHFCWKKNIHDKELRFDVIRIHFNGLDYKIDHIPAAFTD